MVLAATPGRIRPARAAAVFLLVAALLLVAYGALTVLLWVTRDFADTGPLSFEQPAATAPLDGTTTLAQVEQRCRVTGDFDPDRDHTTKIVAAELSGRPYYACYQVKPDGAGVEGDGGRRLGHPRAGPGGQGRRRLALDRHREDAVRAGARRLRVAALLLAYFAYYRRPRPGPPVPARWWQTGARCRRVRSRAPP